jgi:hypothetical protein
MVAQYTYLATDLTTNRVLGELFPNTVSTLDCQLDVAGNMACSFNLDTVGIRNEDVVGNTVPGKTSFWAYRNNQIVWGGIIWTRGYSSATKTLSVTGQTFESYAARRYPRSFIGNGTLKYTGWRQARVIEDLWHRMQAVAHGNIGVRPQGNSNAVQGDSLITAVINGFDMSVTVDTIIQDIIKQPNGPDYTIVWGEDGNGIPTKQLAYGFPIARPATVSNFVVDYPGPIQDYDFIENASTGNNFWWAVGDIPTNSTSTTTLTGKGGSGPPVPAGAASSIPVIGGRQNTNSLNAGWPILEGVETYGGTNLAQLNGRAAADVNQYPAPLVTHATTLTGSDWPQFGSYQLGDYAVINIIDPRYPSGYTFTKRIIGWSIQPPDIGSGAESITIVYDDLDPSNAPGTTTTSLIGL